VRQMNEVDAAFALEYSRLKREMASIRKEAFAISKMDPASRTAEQARMLNDYEAARLAQRDILNNRIKEYYDFDPSCEKARRVEEVSVDQPLRAEQRTANSIGDVIVDGSLEAALLERGVSKIEAKAWIGFPTNSKRAADQAGCDYLLINTHTGRIIPLDITVRTRGMSPGKIAESVLTNPSLRFQDEGGIPKHVPAERRNFVIGVLTNEPSQSAAGMIEAETILSLTDKKMKNERVALKQAMIALKYEERSQLVDIISGAICSKDSPNIGLVESGFPAERMSKTDLSRQYYELHRFERYLFENGYSEWGRALTVAKGFVKDELEGKPRRKN